VIRCDLCGGLFSSDNMRQISPRHPRVCQWCYYSPPEGPRDPEDDDQSRINAEEEWLEWYSRTTEIALREYGGSVCGGT